MNNRYCADKRQIPEMKIVMQNGCKHALSRDDVDAVLQNISPKYFENISNIALYQSQNEDIYVKYYRKEKIIGLFCAKDSKVSKRDVINELLISLAVIYDIDDYPLRLSESRRRHYLEEILE